MLYQHRISNVWGQVGKTPDLNEYQFCQCWKDTIYENIHLVICSNKKELQDLPIVAFTRLIDQIFFVLLLGCDHNYFPTRRWACLFSHFTQTIAMRFSFYIKAFQKLDSIREFQQIRKSPWNGISFALAP